jgi:hypothetical protein
MPTTYAHYRFGRDVYRQLPLSLQESVDQYTGLYNTGVHGPDLLFYYKALTKNPVSQTGAAIHQKAGHCFFEPAALQVKAMADPEPAMVYLFGFICHFTLDSICHPYIEQMVRTSKLSHSAIEAELDRFFLEKDGYPPLSYRPVSHLTPCIFHARIIAPFFPGIGVRKILTCMESQRFYLSLLVVPGPVRNKLARKIAGFKSKSIADMIMPYKKIPECIPMNLHMEGLYSQAVSTAADLIQNYVAYTAGKASLDIRFNHTFGEF